LHPMGLLCIWYLTRGFCIFTLMETKRSYTLQELVDEYQVSVRTMYAWLLPIRKSLLEMTPWQTTS